ncbi:unnamed protein product, partial [Amoebophrya sp. A120]
QGGVAAPGAAPVQLVAPQTASQGSQLQPPAPPAGGATANNAATPSPDQPFFTPPESSEQDEIEKEVDNLLGGGNNAKEQKDVQQATTRSLVYHPVVPKHSRLALAFPVVTSKKNVSRHIPVLPPPDDFDTPFWEPRVVKTVDRIPIAPYSLENMKGNRSVEIEFLPAPNSTRYDKVVIASGEDRRLRELTVQPKSSAAMISSKDALPHTPQVHMHLFGNRIIRSLNISRTGAHCYRVYAPRNVANSAKRSVVALREQRMGIQQQQGGDMNQQMHQTHHDFFDYDEQLQLSNPNDYYELVCRGVSAEVRKLCVLQSSVLVRNGFATVPLLCEITNNNSIHQIFQNPRSPQIPRDYVVIQPEEEISLPLDACREGTVRFAPLLEKSGLVERLGDLITRSLEANIVKPPSSMDDFLRDSKESAVAGGEEGQGGSSGSPSARRRVSGSSTNSAGEEQEDDEYNYRYHYQRTNLSSSSHSERLVQDALFQLDPRLLDE